MPSSPLPPRLPPLARAPPDHTDTQDLHRTATRVLRPSSRTTPLNYGLGSGEPTIVAQGQVEALGDVRGTLRAWGLGKQPF